MRLWHYDEKGVTTILKSFDKAQLFSVAIELKYITTKVFSKFKFLLNK